VIDTALVRQIAARVCRDVVPDAYDEHDRAIGAVLDHMEVCEAPEPCSRCERLVEAADAAFGRLQQAARGRGEGAG
jgi:ferredoxin